MAYLPQARKILTAPLSNYYVKLSPYFIFILLMFHFSYGTLCMLAYMLKYMYCMRDLIDMQILC